MDTESKFYGSCGNCAMFIDIGQKITLVDGVAWCKTCAENPDLMNELNARKPVF